MNLINICICMYVILKPYYMRKSGTIQVADLFIILAFILLILLKSKQKVKYVNIVKLKPLFLFVCSVLVINGIYFLIYGTMDFLLSSFQYIFISIGVCVFYSILPYNNIIFNINKILKINIIIQLIIFLLGLGRYYTPTRYMGTFNDPNQFGFYILLTFMITIVIDKIENRKNKFNLVLLIIVTFLIIKSSSTGMILGLGVYIILSSLYNLKYIAKYINQHRRIILGISMTTLLVLSFIGGLYIIDENVKIKINTKIEKLLNSAIVERIKEKVQKFEKDTEDITFLEDRCLDKIVYYPEYLLFGAGQGYYDRFENVKSNNEIHSTLPSILFCYGIVPFGILIYWIWMNLKKLKFNQYIPYIAILIESFTLLNQRQLLLWFMIIIANKYGLLTALILPLFVNLI